VVESARGKMCRVTKYVQPQGLPGGPGRAHTVEILLQICVRVLSSQTKRKDHNVALEIDQASGFMLVSTMKPFPVTREGSWKRECRPHL
jgi:hypothetical protein